MKKLLFLFAVIVLSSTAYAQSINGNLNTIGIRAGWGAEVSYQRYVAPYNRVEATAGFNRYGFSVEGIYQWMSDINSAESGEIKWYQGVGLGMGDWSSSKFDKGFSIGLLGQVGIEYAFSSVPLLLSIDYRPGIYFAPETHFDWTGFALGIRYRF